MSDTSGWAQVLELLEAEQVGVLGTSQAGHPYNSLVAFVASGDGHDLYFATTRATRKFSNLAGQHAVAMLIDNRTHDQRDFFEAAAVTAYGTAEEVQGERLETARELYLAKHPLLRDFVLAPSCSLFRVRVTCYHLVQQFQRVTEFRIE